MRICNSKPWMVALVMACVSAWLGKRHCRLLALRLAASTRYEAYTPFASRRTPFAASLAQESTPGFVDCHDVSQKEIYRVARRYSLVARRLDHFDAFAGDFAIDREMCSLLAELFV